MSSTFFQKQTNYSYRFISELMDVFLWLVFTTASGERVTRCATHAGSNLISQTTWLKVKLKLVTLKEQKSGTQWKEKMKAPVN